MIILVPAIIVYVQAFTMSAAFSQEIATSLNDPLGKSINYTSMLTSLIKQTRRCTHKVLDESAILQSSSVHDVADRKS